MRSKQQCSRRDMGRKNALTQQREVEALYLSFYYLNKSCMAELWQRCRLLEPAAKKRTQKNLKDTKREILLA